MVLPNLYGSIVQNVVAGITGGVGMAAGASIGRDYMLFSQGCRHAGLDIAGTDEDMRREERGKPLCHARQLDDDASPLGLAELCGPHLLGSAGNNNRKKGRADYNRGR